MAFEMIRSHPNISTELECCSEDVLKTRSGEYSRKKITQHSETIVQMYQYINIEH